VEDNDVAFLVIENSLTLATPITIASDQETEDFVEKESTTRLYGYGQTIFGGGTSKVPMTTTMTFAFKSASIANSAFLRSTTSSACPGDSGGPVIVSTPNKLLLVGIVSGGQEAESGPSCSEKLSDGNYYTLVTLVTKYANLAFQAATQAAEASQKNQKAAESNTQLASASKTKAEADAKLAKEAQTKAEADANAARLTAEESARNSQAELRVAKDSLAKSEEALRVATEAYTVLGKEVEKLQKELESLSSQISTLTASVKTLQMNNSSLNKKLAKVCKAKPKPIGC
jgi:secreted trypsin-like serine protease